MVEAPAGTAQVEKRCARPGAVWPGPEAGARPVG